MPNLLYRRLPVGRPPEHSTRNEVSSACGFGNPRHSRFGNLRYLLDGCFDLTHLRDLIPDERNPGLERVRHELRATGVRAAEINPKRSGVHTRGYLPHVKREGASYFVTYRLADSIPKAVLLQLEQERAERLRALNGANRNPLADLSNEDSINRDFRRKIERYLDEGHGACHLKHPKIADMVADNLRHFEGQRYLLRAWVVMPNHVHVIVWPMPNYALSEIVKTWKQYTSRRIKPVLGLKPGRFWQPESYDHWIRDNDEFARIARYIRNNPVKAGLCVKPEDWRWSSEWRSK